jgi:tripartite motif-containing protein 71
MRLSKVMICALIILSSITIVALTSTVNAAADQPPVFILKWGTPHNATGQFDFPGGVCSDPSGNIYVIDTYNNRVQKFNSNGVYITQWGTEGTGNGQFELPQGICSDPSGNIYVTDTGNNRVQKFNSSGVYIIQWGTIGAGNGQFNNSYGICSDPSGNIYVADTGNFRIQKFSSNGVYITQWGTEGFGDGQFENPRGVGSDPSGNIYVADTDNNRIQKFNSTGFYLTKWGLPGTGNGEFNAPQGVCSDPTGNIYVADSSNYRVQKFTSDGVYIRQWGTPGTGNGQFSFLGGVCSDPSGNIYVADSGNDRIQKFNSIGGFILAFPPNSNGRFAYPFGVCSDPSGSIYVADTSNSRIQKFNSNGVYLTQWGSQGSANGQLLGPGGVCSDPSGSIYVADSGNNRIEKFTSNGVYITQWGTTGTGNGQFENPEAVCSDPSGNIYVADTANNRVQKFNSNGGYLTQWGTEGASGGQFENPYGICSDPSGSIYVADTFNYRVQKFNSTGGYLTQWGTTGTGDGQFDSPFGVGSDPSGNIYVADTVNNRIQKFNSTGGYLTQWGTTGTGDGQFESPQAVCSDPSGNIYVADTNNNRIQKFAYPSPPTVISTSPVNGATNVPVTTLIKATFNKSINASTINTSTFLVRNGGPVTGSVTYYPGNLTAVFAPSASLLANKLYTANITTGVADNVGTHMTSNYVWTFTTATTVVPNASYVSDTIPASMITGNSYGVNVTMMNTGNVNWTAADLFRLGAVGDAGGDAAKFGPLRVNITPGTVVQPGQTYTFRFTMTAPSTPAVYHPSYRMVWDGHQWFGSTLVKTVTVAAVTPNAVVVSNTIPSSMVAGQSYPVSITMQNTGNVNWTAAELFRLGAVGGSSGDAAKFGVQRVNITPGTIVQPGQSYTFSFTMVAPGTAGTYNPSYQMVWDGHQWFGGILTKTIVVSAITPNAAFVSDTIPSSMVRGSSHPVNVTMRNTGNVNWTAAQLFRLGAVGGSSGDAAKFGVQRVNITPGTIVQPGQSYTFSFTMVAPSTAGTYHPSYQMVWDGHQWFGATDTKTINVT